MTRTLRLLFGPPFLALALCLAPASARSAISVAFVMPSSGSTVDTPLFVAASIASDNEIASASASMSTASVPLTFGPSCGSAACPSPPRWSGSLDLSGLARGPHQLVVTATDVLGNSGSAAIPVFYDRSPRIEVISPQPGDIARPEIALVAYCHDDNPAGCASFQAFIKPFGVTLGGRVAATGATPGEINTVVNVADFDGTQPEIIFFATDSAQRSVGQSVRIAVEASSVLEESLTVAGRVQDVDDTRVLHFDERTLALRIRDRASGTETQVNAGATPMVAGLTSAGAAFGLPQAASPFTKLESFENGTLRDLGGLNGGTSNRSRGRYLLWSDGSSLKLRDVVNGVTSTVTTHAGNTDNDVTSTGAVAYWSDSYDIFLVNPDSTSTRLTFDSRNFYPVTDGDGVAYGKTNADPCCVYGQQGLYFYRGGSTQALVDFTSIAPLGYRVANGWVAYDKPGPSNVPQVWQMTPGGAQVQLTFGSVASHVEELAQDGALTYLGGAVPQRRFLVPQGAAAVEIGSALGRTFFVSNSPYVALERTLFSTNLGALRFTPAAAAFPARGLGMASREKRLVVTNAGSTSVTISSTVASGDFSVRSNGCSTVPPGGTCPIDVVFAPTAAGSRTGSLTIQGTDGTHRVSLSGVGLGGTQLSNISTRAKVGTGGDVVIGGFVVSGSGSKTVVVTAAGPSLTAFGIPSALPNPVLQLIRQSDGAVLATNDNWGDAPNAAQIQAAGYAPADALEPAVMMTLPAGAYTAVVSGAGGASGVGLVAVYELDHPEVPLVNISTRGQVLTGNDVMIAGFVIQGTAPQTVVIAATGPSLAQFGVANALTNPTLRLVRQADQATIAINDDWGSAPNATQIQAAGFAPSDSRESAIMVTLDPGAYTAVLSGVGGATGVGVIAVYRQ